MGSTSTPGLILRHNLHGIDIDPRCAQIAALALWMRAQRAFHEMELLRTNRPMISKTNIVVAEPMSDEKDMVDEFAASLKPTVLGDLFKTIVEKMKLAGELGSLLRIEEEIAEALAKAEEQTRQGSLPLVEGENLLGKDFWAGAEEILLGALHAYAEQAAAEQSTQRRLFAEDAAQGVALIHLLRQRYDVVLMNPPFGEFTKKYKALARRDFPSSYNDILAAFTLRWYRALDPVGMLGAITSRTCFFLTTFAPWREALLFKECALELAADLGEGVMDDAMVEAAAYVVRQNRGPQPSLFFRMLGLRERAGALREVAASVKAHSSNPRVFLRELTFCQSLPDAPLVYWVSAQDLSALATLPRLEPCAAKVRQGMVTGDNPRFVRVLWEVPYARLAVRGEFHDASKNWAPLVMKGASQPWYSPMTVVVQWAGYGAEIKARWIHKGDHPSRNVRSEELYFRPGMSWTRRAVRFIPYAIPAGAIPTASRYMAFPEPGEAYAVLGITASNIASAFLRFYGEWFTRPNYLVENVKALPWPETTPKLREELEALVQREVACRRRAYQNHEPYHDFVAPSILFPTADGESLSRNLDSFFSHEVEMEISAAYGLSAPAYEAVTRDLREAVSGSTSCAGTPSDSDAEEEDEDNEDFIVAETPYSRQEALVSYVVGVLFGRWDVRIVQDHTLVPTLAGPFDPLLPSPTGCLIGADGLPATSGRIASEEWLRARARGAATPANATVPDSAYPVRIAWDGILLNDSGHAADLPRRIREVFESIFGSSEEAQWLETAEVLEGLGESIRKWLETSFFRDHLGRYSKSRRKAPIYWQLATPSASYSVWLYYHRFTRDTFYKVLNDYVTPKLQHEERKLNSLRQEHGQGPTASQRKEIAAHEHFVEELRAFRAEVARIAPLWNPDLDDGVIINFAPLWRLVPQHRAWQKECKDCWERLAAGEYDWSHLAMHLWPERVVPKCAADRSLAIAHGLEDVFWFEDDKGKWRPRSTPTKDIEALVRERTSPAVKAALQSLLGAPIQATTGRRSGKHARTPKEEKKTHA